MIHGLLHTSNEEWNEKKGRCSRHHETPLYVGYIVIGAIKEAFRSPHQLFRMNAPCPCLIVKQNANRKRGSAVVGIFMESRSKNFAFL